MAAVDFITLAELKTHLEITSDSDNALLAAAITAASGALNDRCGLQLTPKATATRTLVVDASLTPNGEGLVFDLAPYVLRSASAVSLNPEEASPTVLVANTDYALWPVAGDAALSGAWRRLKFAYGSSWIGSTFLSRFGISKLQIAGGWGAWDTADVPAQVKRACAVTVGSWVDRAVAEYGATDAGDPRQIRPSRFQTWAIPNAAYSLLVEAGLVRWSPFR